MIDSLVQPTELELLLAWLKTDHGADFTGYARPGLTRLLRSRIEEAGARDIASYRARLQSDPAESARLLDGLLLHVTGFFRDPAAWVALARQVLPSLFDSSRNGDVVRVWCPGCASGEEAYSLAMLIAETIGLEQYRRRVKIFATDRDPASVEKARRGVFPPAARASVPEAFLSRYFVHDLEGVTVDPALRGPLTFGDHDLARDPPIGRLDLVVCRNTVMYLDAATQARVFARFGYAVRPGGFLFLGAAEHPPFKVPCIFEPVSIPHKIFSRTAVSNRDLLLGVDPCTSARRT